MEATGKDVARANAVRIELGGATDVGRRREHNEDDWTIFGSGLAPGWMVAVVADGMGGHNAGEVASALAIDVIERELGAEAGAAPPPSDGAAEGARSGQSTDSAASAPSAADPSRALAGAIERANRAIWDEGERDPSRSGMGTTVLGAIFADGRAYLANVGDSPAFLVRDGQSWQVTRDHGWVAEQVEAGLIAPEDAPHHPYRNILTRCPATCWSSARTA